jgi:hypothetical protein
MTYLVSDFRTKFRPGIDLARYTTVDRIRSAHTLFTVMHDPVPENPLHVTVSCDGDWDETLATLFEACFTEDHQNA